ncbi:MAG: S-layer family protein, partial [Cyanobacteria bacterium SZAS LIN-3]|nr:S-layer family protein [Cyanobacteria bacterium SZAS LIN-3]
VPQTSALHTGNVGSPSANGWATHAGASAFTGQGSAFGDIGKSQSGIPLIHQMPGHAAAVTNFNAAAAIRHAHANPTGLTFVNPNTGGFTNELGQTGHNLALDLTSTTADIVLGSRLFGGAPSVTIDVGGQPTTYRAGSVVTAGEYVAIQQVLGGHTQGVTLSNSGAATGGNFVLNAVDNRQLQSLVIPASVSAVDYFSKSPVLTINADLTNYGSIYGVSTNPNITNGTIIAHDITNAVGGTISTVIPDSMVSAISGTINSSLDLSLYATNNFTNAGSIYGSGVVNIFAGNNIVNALPTGVSGPTPVIHAVNNVNFMTGSGNFTNAGVVASANNNINILAAEATTNLNINNVGGSLQALQGDINVRDASYDGSASVTMTGGDFLSNNLNIYSGTGDIYGDVGQVTGNLNTVGGAAHFYAATDNLSLGKNCLVGDPTFANTTGGITINGQVTAAENIVILAATNIIASGPGAEIDTANSGGSITMVAGATITNTGIDTSGTPTGTGAIGAGKQAQADFGTVTTGGSIILTGGAASPVINTSTSSNNLSAGNVTLVAMAGTTAGSGVVSLPVNSINASSAGATAPGGNVTIIANGTGANTITAGAINTTSAQNVSGNVSITTTTATVNAPNASPLGGGTNNSIVFNNDGTTASGNFIVPGNAAGAFVPSSPTAGGVTINNAINAGSSGSVNINAGSISTSNAGSITGTQVALTTVSSLGSGGAITAKGAINADNLTVQTAGGAVSGGNIQLGAIGGSAGGDATSVTVTTGGAGGSGGTITFTGTVNADTLDVTSGGAGGFGGDININGALNANSMTIHAGGAGLQAGSVTATKGITADTLDLSTGGSGSGAGGNISLASVGGKSAADASSVTLDAGTSGGTIDASGAVSTQTLNLTSNGGNVGSNNGGITTDASTINAATANKGSLSLNTTAATATITTDSPTLSVKGTGNVTISDSYNGGSTPIVVNASSAGAGSTFQLTATGNDGANGTGLNVNSTLSAGNVLLTSAAGPTANGGDINVNGTISATNTTISTGNGPTNGGNITVGAAGVIKGLAGDATSVTLTAAGSGSIQDNGPGTSANILTNTLTMTSGTGTIGTGIPGTPLSGTAIATNASTVSASTGDTNPLEGIYINDFQTGAVFVNGLSSGSNVAFNGASSNLTLNGPISGFGIALANAGNIAIAGDITATGAQGILIETTNGFGNITQTNSKAIISDTTAGASIFLTSLIGVVPVGGGKGLGTGNIGAVGAPINVNAPQLLVQTASKSAVTGNVYLASLNTSGTSLSNSGSFGASQGGIIDVTSIGPVTIGTTVNNKLSAINADTVRISTSFGGGITLNQNINGQLGVGANANSITLAASGGGNIVDNSQNTQVTGANQGTLNTLSLTLSTGSGNIGTPGVGFGTGIVTNATTLQATSTGSYIFVNDQTNGTVNVLASSAGTGGNPVGFLSGSVFRVTSFGGVNTTGAISADNIGLIAGQGGTGNLNIGANLTALNNVFLNSTATSTGSDITQSAGLISAQNLIMLSDHGTIGQSAANIQTNAVQMSANIAQNTAPGNENVFINNINTNPVTLNASQAAGNFTLTTAGALTVNGMAVDGKVSITTANNGGVNLAGNIAGFKNVSGNAKSVTISADGSGDVENLGIFTISTDKLVISSGSGSIGDAPIITNATTLQFNTTGTVIVVDTAKTDVTLLASSASGAGSDFDLTMTGLTNAKLIISGALTAGNNADIQSNSGGGNIQISNTITAGTSANLVADGSVGITQTAGVVDTPLLTATTTNGGSIGASSVAPITTTATTITATSAGNAFLKATNANPVTITGVAAAGKTFQLTDTGSNGLIIVGAAGISGGKFINLLGGTGSNVGIELDGNVTAAGINSVITLAANGTGAITDVAQGAPTLSASSLVLSSGSGDIGASTAYIQTDAATVSTNTKGQSFINDSAALVNLAASTGSNITLNALAVNTTGNTTVTGNLNINTSTITNNNTLTGSTINVVGDNMLVLGTGQFTAAVVTNITSTLGDLNFGDGVVPGIMTFSGPANFTVPAFNAINVNDKYVVNGLNSVTLNTCTLNLNGTGTLFGNPIIFNCPLGAGTIANSTGDVNLTSNLIFNGKDLAIIASGNVIASSPITIDLSNTNPLVNKGNGGSLNILAGVDFTPGTNLGAGGQEGPDGVFYTIAAGGGAASISGGSIQMAGSLVRTASGVGSANSGTVTLAAYGGVTNPGSIAIGSITTAFAAGGKAGAVTVVGQGNVTVGSITAASGLNGADVVVSSATPVVVSTIKDQNGTFLGGPIVAGVKSTGLVTVANVIGNNFTSSGGALTVGTGNAVQATNGGNVTIDVGTGAVTLGKGSQLSGVAGVGIEAGSVANDGKITSGQYLSIDNSASLVPSDLTLTGSGTYATTTALSLSATGNIGLDGLFTGAFATAGGATVLVVAGGNISSTKTGTINTSNIAGAGGAISLIAGANYVFDVKSPTTVTVSQTANPGGGSATGGTINMPNISLAANSTSGANGGNITLGAYGSGSGTPDGTGLITVSNISTTTSGLGQAGYVLIGAGGTTAGPTAASITTGNIAGGGQTPPGIIFGPGVYIGTASPVASVGGVVFLSGVQTSGQFAAGTFQTGGVTTGNITSTSTGLTTGLGNIVGVRAGGNISANDVTGQFVVLQATQGSNGGVQVHNINAPGFVTLTGDGTGTISQTAGGLITTPTLTATVDALGTAGAGTGDITVNTTNGASPINLSIASQGNVTDTNLGSVNLVSLNGAGATKTYSVTTSSNAKVQDAFISIQVPIAAGTINLSTSSQNGFNGSITQSIGGTSLTADAINLSAKGTPGFQDITLNTAAATSGTDVAMTANTTGSVFINNIGGVSFGDSKVGGGFTLFNTADGAGNSSITVSAGKTVSAGGQLEFVTDQTGSTAPSVTVGAGSTLSAANMILETTNVTNNGSISSKGFLAVDNSTGGQGLTFGGTGGTWSAGTVLVAAATNDVDLAGLFNANQTVNLKGANFAAIAGGDIVASGAETAIVTGGGQINMFAGANYNTGTLQVTPGAGGDVTFNGGLDSSNKSGSGGLVQVVAYGNGATGTVNIGGDIKTGGSGSNSNGDVLVLAGSNASIKSITLANVDTSGASSKLPTGDITIATAAPNTNPISFTLSGTTTPAGVGATALGEVSTGNLTSGTGNVLVIGTEGITTGSVTATKGSITETSTALNGFITATGDMKAGTFVNLQATNDIQTTNVTASTGAVTENSAAGSITNGDVFAGTNVGLSAAVDITTAKVTAGTGINETAGNDLTATGDMLTTNGNVKLTATGSISTAAVTASNGTVNFDPTSITATGIITGTTVDLVASTFISTVGIVSTVGATTVNAGTTFTDTGAISSATKADLTAGTDMSLGSASTSNGDLTATATAGSLSASGALSSKNGLTSLTAGTFISTNGITATGVGSSITAKAGSSITDTGSINAGTTVNLDAGTFISTVGVAAGTGLTETAKTSITDTTALSTTTGNLSLTAGTSISAKDITATAGSVTATTAGGTFITATGAINAGTTVSLTAETDISTTSVTAGTGVTETANTGSITATGTISTTTSGAVVLNAVTGITTTDVTANGVGGSVQETTTGKGSSIKGNVITGNTFVTLTADQDITTDAVTATTLAVTETATNGLLTANGDITAGTSVSLTAGSDISVVGVTASNGFLSATSNKGSITATGNMSSNGGDTTLLADTFISTLDVTATGTGIEHITETATNGSITGGKLTADKSIALTAGTDVTTSDLTSNLRRVDVTAGTGGKTGSITAGAVSANFAIGLSALDNITTDSQTTQTFSISNTATNGFIQANGALSSNGSVTLSAGTDISTVGVTAKNGSVSETATKGSITDTTSIAANTTVNLTAGTFISTGDVSGNTSVTETAKNGDINSSGVITTPVLVLSATTGIGSLGSPLQTKGVGGTIDLTAASTSGAVAIDNNGAVVLLNANGTDANSTFQLITTPDSTNGNGSISIGNGVTGATVSGGTLIISSSEDSSIVGATGGISEGKASTTPTLTGTTIVLTDHDVTGLANGNGDITVGMTNGGALINLVANTDGDVNLNAYGSSVNLNGASSGFFFNLTTNSDSTNINGAIALNAGIKAFATQLTSSEFTGGTGGISGPGVIDAGFVTLADHDSNGAPFNTNGTGNISANTTNSAGGSVILQANTTGNVTIVDTSKSLVMNSSTGKDITLTANAVDTFKLPSTIAATGNLTINTDSLTVQNGDTFKGLNVFINGVTPDNNKVNMVVTNDGTIQATGQNLTIASAAGQNLVVGSSLPLGGTLSATDSGAGDGHISVVASNDVGNNIFPTLEFTGSQTFAFTGGTKTGVVDLTSKGAATSGIIIDAPATLTFNMNGSAINLNTCTVVLNGTLDINPIGFGVPVNTLTLNCPLAASTIARSDGAPLNLNGLNLTFNGLDLNILSAGDIEDTKIGTDTINLSSATKGGSVNIIAGFKFAPGTLPGGQTEISNKLYTLTSQNPLGGSILLGNVNINTSGGTDGGNVFVVANAGSIVLGKVTTTGSTGNGGSVTMYGDGIVANNINTSGGLASGNVDLQSVTTVGLPAANIYVGGGKVFGGSFVLGTPGGEINLTSVTSPGANVSIITGGMGVGTSGVIASGTINAGNLLIVSGIDGSTGIKTTATTLTASSLGDIDITDSSAVTLVDNGTFKNTSALGAYTLTTTGAASDITVTDAVSATTNMTLKAGGALAINNTVDGITVDLSSGGNTTINDAVTATLSGTVTSSGAVTVTGAGSFTAGTSLDVVATNNVTVDGFVTANTDLNVTSSKGDITGGGTYTSTVGNIILAADGNIWQDSSTALNISTANINAAATKGSVNLLNDQTTNIVFVGANSNSAGGTYTLTTSTGDINLNDDVSGGTGVSLVSPGALTGAGTVTATTGDILLQAVTAVNLTGSVAAFTGNVGISGNSVLTFDVLGTKSVTEISTTTIDSTGVITGANLTFNAGTGIASLGTPLQTAGVNGTTNLTATTKTGDVAINNNGAVVLIGTNSAKAGTFQLSTTPDGTTGDGSISIGDATNGATVSAVTINLTSSEDSTIFGSKGGIHEGAASVTPTLSSGNINLTDLDETLAPGTGDIVVGLRNPGGAPINLTANTAGNVDLHTFGSTVNIAGTSTGDTFSIVTASSAGVTKNGNIVLNNDIIANNIILTSSEYTGGTGGVSGAGVLHADSVTIVDTNSAGVPGNTTGKGVINVNTDNALGSTTFSAQSAAAITVTDNSLTSLILGNISGATVRVNGNAAVDTVGGGANVLVRAST